MRISHLGRRAAAASGDRSRMVLPGVSDLAKAIVFVLDLVFSSATGSRVVAGHGRQSGDRVVGGFNPLNGVIDGTGDGTGRHGRQLPQAGVAILHHHAARDRCAA